MSGDAGVDVGGLGQTDGHAAAGQHGQHGDASLAHLLGRAATVEERVRDLVARRRAVDPQPDDPFRGLYLSDDAVDRLLAGPRPGPAPGLAADARTAAVERAADEAERAGDRLRLRGLVRRFGLSPLDVDLLLVALVCDLDARFEQLFGYLNDDVTRRRPATAVALELCGADLASAHARARLTHGPLVTGGLLAVEDPDRPFPGRALRVPDRVVEHLLGHDAPDAALAPVLVAPPDVRWGEAGPLARALDRGVTLTYLREGSTGSARVLAVQALRALGRDAVVVDLHALAAEPDAHVLARSAAREARLRGAGLVAGPVEAVATRPRLLAALVCDPEPLLLVGRGAWDPGWTTRPPLLLTVPASTTDERSTMWLRALGAGSQPTEGGEGTDDIGGSGGSGGGAGPSRGARTARHEAAAGIDDATVEAATLQFRLRPEQVARAAASALAQARVEPDGQVTAEHLRAGARAENGSALDGLARRIEPAVGWADLVLPRAPLIALREVALRARHRERVLGDWSMRPGGGRGHGVAALFAGDSGTGKTMSAEVVAHELGLDLYVVDLATVVDKYIGETEKNLERIFGAAAGVNGVLLFDEADAIFGRRSEVRDSHDRYANIESAYLLQRMESFDGLAILATNLRANIDEAFTRRLDVLVDFPLPDAEHRRALWDRCLGALVPRDPDVDLDFVAGAFELAGGAIRSSAVTAAYLAADDGGTVRMTHVISAVEHEYRKLGRLCLPGEFGRYWSMLQPTGA
ncbi:AAA family ATPase [Cellulomonas cellasea]|uniref:ATPase n=1 Tax=Cellulomonas cellasea TaxID=43670 RepID=A0A4Y3KZ51_9CELL|nr:ATP-binding protein [Cellulomonas cellasea]GEA89751.1 ATPase [Cellulomonas cellasea]